MLRRGPRSPHRVPGATLDRVSFPNDAGTLRRSRDRDDAARVRGVPPCACSSGPGLIRRRAARRREASAKDLCARPGRAARGPRDARRARPSPGVSGATPDLLGSVTPGTGDGQGGAVVVVTAARVAVSPPRGARRAGATRHDRARSTAPADDHHRGDGAYGRKDRRGCARPASGSGGVRPARPHSRQDTRPGCFFRDGRRAGSDPATSHPGGRALPTPDRCAGASRDAARASALRLGSSMAGAWRHAAPVPHSAVASSPWRRAEVGARPATPVWRPYGNRPGGEPAAKTLA